MPNTEASKAKFASQAVKKVVKEIVEEMVHEMCEWLTNVPEPTQVSELAGRCELIHQHRCSRVLVGSPPSIFYPYNKNVC